MSERHRYELTRITPQYNGLERSAKPIDAFNDGVYFPQIFDLKINEDWHQVVYYNTQLEQDIKKAKEIFDSLPKEDSYKKVEAKNKKVKATNKWPTSQANTLEVVGLIPTTLSAVLGDADEDGGLGLDKNKSYYVYDFWNKNFLGKFKGSDTLSQDLREGEARMMSIHTVQDNPQFISTDRHILQGFIDMIVLPSWDAKAKALSGTSAVIGQDPYKVIIALNGSEISKLEANANAKIEVIDEKNGLAEMTLSVEENTDVKWSIFFK